MQSFGDDTLFAHISIEKKGRLLREQNEDKVLQEESGSDVSKNVKQNLPVSKFTNKDSDVDKPKLSHSTHNTKGTIKPSESDFIKYFEDSILFPRINGRNNISSTSSTLKENRILSSKTNRSPRENKGNINAISSIEKHSSNIINNVKKRDKSSAQNLHKNGSHDDIYNTISGSSVAVSSSIDSTCDKEISSIILSRALCTQDRCKLASWGLPPNILQVL